MAAFFFGGICGGSLLVNWVFWGRSTLSPALSLKGEGAARAEIGNGFSRMSLSLPANAETPEHS